MKEAGMFRMHSGVKFGVDYYPEQWDRSLWKSDLARIREMGATEVRLMEFAWPVLEPRKGRYDFSLFDEVMKLCEKEGLQVILGTPTATTPAWLVAEDPSIVQVHPSGKAKDWGSRREACLNAPLYRKHSQRVVEAVAKHYGKSPVVAGWQVDNEIAHEGSDICVCAHCAGAWHAWLKARYGTVDALNRAWGAVFWGRTLSDFTQALVPREQVSTDQNPGLLLDYDRFCSDTAVAHAGRQIDILRKHARHGQFITTNLYMPPLSNVVDMEELFRDMDLVGYDNYPVWGDMAEPLPWFFNSFILSYIRGLKQNQPFSVLEQISGFQGHVCLGYRPPEEQMALWTNQAIAHGANRISYFRWRTALYGQEQLCYGIIDADNTETRRYTAIRDNIRNTRAICDSIGSEPVPAKACLVYDMDNIRVVKRQYLSKGLVFRPTPYHQIGYAPELARHFAPYALFGINADVRTPASVTIERYRVISLPLCQMTDGDFVDSLKEWVHDGGTLILGWRAGTRDRSNHSVKMELPGLFSELAGVRIREFEALGETKVGIRMGLIPCKGEIWADILEQGSAQVVARYTDGSKYYRGKACVTVNSYGNGRVWYLGTSPNELALFLLYRKIFKEAGMNPKFRGKGIEVVRRATRDGGEVDIVLNHTGKKKRALGAKLAPYGVAAVPVKK